MSGIVAHQSDLESFDEGKGIEGNQATANLNTVIVLKNSDNKLLEKLNKRVQKKIVRRKREEIEVKRSGQKSDKSVQIEEKEMPFFDEGQLENLKSGQGWLIKGKYARRMITYFLPNKRYSKKNEATLPIAKTMALEAFLPRKPFTPEAIKEVKENTIDLSTSQTYSKPKQTAKAKVGRAFEKQLIARFKKEGYTVLDGASDENYASFDAEGIDLIAENDKEIILIQAKNWVNKTIERDDAVIICSKLENYYRKTYLDKTTKSVKGLVAIVEKTKLTAPAKDFFRDKADDKLFKIDIKKYEE